ncbi:SpaA isopeptide-forming pilin-related protein [Romboutsia hominis]|uniref:SpaA isopeptide-forming pilin-related protein n=1 Tax=Romboutsia hominis TaxID=1507512 RepID=UPI000A8DFAB0|nr:SpaA isopeptide-forming pilin-related protein [Romboutsia hominis]
MKNKYKLGKKIISILTSVLMVINVLINTHFAYAEEVKTDNQEDTIEVSITCDKKEVEPREKLNFKLEYKAKYGPGSIKPGDTIEFEMPSWLERFSFKFPPEHFKSVQMEGNKVVATFGDDVYDAIGGYVNVSAYADKTEEVDNQKIEVWVDGKPVTSIEIAIKPSDETEPIIDRQLLKTINNYDHVDSDGNTVGNIYYPVLGKTQQYRVYVNEKFSNISNAVLTDNMPEGMELIPSSVNVIKIERDSAETDVTDSLNISKSSNRLSINFGNIKDKYIVTYKTKITQNLSSYKNTAVFNKSDGKLNSTVILKQKNEAKDVISKYSYTSAKNSEGKNVASMNENVRYRIDINENRSNLKNVTLNDFTPKGMELLKDSISIGKYNKDESFEWVTDQFKDKINTNNGNLTINFGNVDDYYIVCYDMKITNVEDSYSNTAKLSYNGTRNSVDDTVKYEYNAGAINAHKSVDKTKLEKDDDQSVVYSINFESFGVFQKGYIDLVDKLDPNVKIVKVEVPDAFSSKIDKANNTVNIINDKGQINYKENLEVKIYTDFSNVKDGTTVSNIAKINGNPSNKVETKKGYAFEAIKVDSENKESKLSGAIFNLKDSNKKVIGKLTSDENGLIKSDVDNVGTYYLQEVKAPEGYSVDGKDIKFTIEKSDIGTVKNIGTITNEKTNGEVEIKKVDKDNTSKVLPGTEFEIQTQDGQKVTTIITGEDGIARASLKPGKYQVVETKASKGYLLTNEVKNFEIKFNQKEDVKLVFENEKEEPTTENINNKLSGEVEIKKVDKDDTSKVLPGTEFEIQTQDGQKVTKIITGEDGIARASLKPGKYRAVEIKASEGYLLTNEVQNFEIKFNQKEDVKLVFENEKEEPTVKDTNNKQSESEDKYNNDNEVVDEKTNGEVEIKEVDKDNPSKVLPGTEFAIQTQDGKKVTTIVTGKDGIAKVGLEPGKYQAVEIKAPKGYPLTNEVQNFEIKPNQKENVKLVFEGQKDEVSEKNTNSKTKELENKYHNEDKVLDKNTDTPKTGEESIIGSIVLVILALAGIIFINKRS